MGCTSLLAWTGAVTTVVGAGVTITQLSTRASEITQGAGGTVGFSVACGRPPRTISANEDEVLRGASTLKVGIVLADAINRGASGKTLLADQLSRRAIIDSDNSAANELFARAGGGSPARGVQATNALFAALGMERTRFDGPYVDTSARSQKVTTASDLRVLAENVQRLARDGSGPLAAQGATKDQARSLVDLMSRSTYPSVFSASGNEKIAHKSGWLGNAQNDLAIITLQGGETCAAGFVSEGLSLPQAQAVGSKLMREVVQPLATSVPPGGAAESLPSPRPQVTTAATVATGAGAATTATAGAPPPVGTVAAGSDADREADATGSWVTDWRVWALAGLAGAVVLIVARQRQLDRRRRSRAAQRRRSR